jgi:hypothetical protein
MSDALNSDDVSSWVEECLRLRYGKHRKAGAVLSRLVEITQTMKSNPRQGQEEFGLLAEYVGAIILKQALSGETRLLKDLTGAIEENGKGLSGDATFMSAYLAARHAILLSLADTNADVDPDEVHPSVHDIIEAYLHLSPRTPYDSAESQVKRWLKKTGHKTCPKGTRFTS